MKVKTRIMAAFLAVVLVGIAGAGGLAVLITRASIRRMVENESREMVATISDAILLASGSSGANGSHSGSGAGGTTMITPEIREFVLERRIGETGFFFILGGDATYLVHPKAAVEGQNWLGEHAFIGEIMSQSGDPGAPRFARYVSPQTGQWKQVYFDTVAGSDLIVCSSAWEHEMYAPLYRVYRLIGAVMLGAIIVAGLVARRISGRLGSSLTLIAQACSRVAEGDLTISLPVDTWTSETFKTATGFNQAIPGSLNAIIGRVRTLAEAGDRSSERLAGNVSRSIESVRSVADRVHGLDEAISSLHQASGESERAVAELTEHMTALEAQAAEQSAAATESSAAIEEAGASIASVRNVAERQTDHSSELVEELQGYQRAVDQLNRALADIGKRLKDITAFNQMIHDVADQTHMLAMNAAIEAARAGDVGRGFGVVAAEIRSLAESTNQNANQVGETLGQITNAISETIESGERLGSYFSRLRDGTEQFIGAFKQISEGTAELDGAAREIVAATTSVAEGSNEVRTRTGAVREAAKTVSDLVDRVRAIAEQSHEAFSWIESGTSELVTIQEDVQVITDQNRENNRVLVEGTRRFVTDSDNGGGGTGEGEAGTGSAGDGGGGAAAEAHPAT